MLTIADIAELLSEFAPPRLAASWDNVGLLIGDARRPADRVMTCLTLTQTTAAEAVAQSADLVIAHHPLPFHALKRITADDPSGRVILQMIESKVAVYSPHSAFDSCRKGINQQLAAALQLTDITPLTPADDLQETDVGTGRVGCLEPPQPLSGVIDRLKTFLNVPHIRYVGDADSAVSRIAIACGSGGSMLRIAIAAGANGFLTGEASFHDCLLAEQENVSLLLVGHYASERFAVETLAEHLQQQLPDATIWPARTERNPIARSR